MSILFADIFEAIRTLRACKGTTEKDILNYVQERAGGCLSVNNVLKTVCTLNKLVDEGVLEKRGKRYSLPKPPPKQDEDEEMDQEEEKEDDCDKEDEDEDDDMKDSCDDMGGDDEEEDCGEDNKCNEEDDDDDDDDDDEEDDDDDDEEDTCKNQDEEDEDDDDDCNDKLETNDKKDEKKDDCPENEDEVQSNGNGAANNKGNGKSKSVTRSKTGNGELNCNSLDNKTQDEKFIKTNKARRLSAKLKAETIAFCARDFMDAQYRAYPSAPVTEAFAKMEDVMEEDLELDEKPAEVSNIFQARKRGTRSKRSHLSNSNYRSRSPVKGMPADPYQHRLEMEQSDEIGALDRQLYQEPGEMDLDVEPNRRGDLVGVDFDLYRDRSPAGSPSLNGPDILINRKDSSCSTQDKKEIKMEPAVEGITQCGLKRQAESAMTMLRGKDKNRKIGGEVKREKHKREALDNKIKDEEKRDEKKMHMSVCSVCEKKKKKKN